MLEKTETGNRPHLRISEPIFFSRKGEGGGITCIQSRSEKSFFFDFKTNIAKIMYSLDQKPVRELGRIRNFSFIIN